MNARPASSAGPHCRLRVDGTTSLATHANTETCCNALCMPRARAQWHTCRIEPCSGSNLSRMEESEWRSIRGKKAPWSEAEVAHAAQTLLDALTERVKSIIQSDAWKGGVLVKLQDTVHWNVVCADLRRPVLCLCLCCACAVLVLCCACAFACACCVLPVQCLRSACAMPALCLCSACALLVLRLHACVQPVLLCVCLRYAYAVLVLCLC